MPAARNPRWTIDELAVLRRDYPLGGLQAVIAQLPSRSWHSIYVKAHKLGIKCEKPSGGGRRCQLQGEKLEEAIRLREVDGWGFGRIGAHLGFCEATVTNAVTIALCHRKGFTPAARTAAGRLTEDAIDRLRLMLRKGLKGVDIQLRLGVSAACVAEQRRRYNADLKARGKALLPPPGGGEAYSGVKVSPARKREAERLFLEGYGTLKVSQQSGVSKTVCTRIRNKLIARLRRKGECLPGCDIDGFRRVQKDSARLIPGYAVSALRAHLMAGMPCIRAARMVGVGGSSSYRIRDELIAELAAAGKALPASAWRGKRKQVSGARSAPAIPGGAKGIYRYRLLCRRMRPDEARAQLEREVNQAGRDARAAARPRTFEEQLEAVAQGRVSLVEYRPIRRPDPSGTLGGVATGAL